MAKGKKAGRNLISKATREVVLVDGHAHNVVGLNSSLSFLHAFTEAGDDVLNNVPHTIPFKRGIQDLASLYNIEPSLPAILAHRNTLGLEKSTSICFSAAKIDTLLLDDGLLLQNAKDLDWHRSFCLKVHRILRIEALAEEILNRNPAELPTFAELAQEFCSRIETHVVEKDWNPFEKHVETVVALKSIAAYRSGLDINPYVEFQEAEKGLLEDIQRGESSEKKYIRLMSKPVIDFLFSTALEIATEHGVPMQLHTGFGDKDLDLRQASPLHLRAVLEHPQFANSRLVLLHASYPYMREATYLASVYDQVFLDFGLAIPKLTIRGMREAVSELLELAPLNKVMFSTDGCAFPETHYLGAKWSREILSQVLCQLYDDGDLSVESAVSAAHDLLRNNSLAFYKLKDEGSTETPNKIKAEESTETPNKKDKERTEKANKLKEEVRIGTLHKKKDEVETEALHKLTELSSKTPWLENDAKHVRLMWSDGSGQRRCRVVPVARYKAVVAQGGIGLTKCAMGMSSFSDGPAAGSGLTEVGEIRLIPDEKTGIHVPQWGHALVLAEMHEKPGTPWEYCPRSTLRRLIDILQNEFGLSLRAGFETEFYLLRKEKKSDGYEGVDFTSYCSTDGLNQAMPAMDSILSWLETFGVDVEQFHAEGGGGQFEIAIAHDTALRSADKLLLAREAIKAAAVTHDLVATFLPKLFLKNTPFGTGCHCHLSLTKDGKNVLSADDESTTSKHGVSSTGEHFMAGLLHHLPSVLAFVAPHPVSYDRIQPNTWSGAFQCWGHENREAPLRAIGDLKRSDVINNFELKSFDGCANPHLGLAAILAAGLDGLRKKMELPPPVDVNPALLEAGQVPRLPSRLEESTKCLEENSALKDLLGEKLVTAIVAIRKAESWYYTDMRSREILIFKY